MKIPNKVAILLLILALPFISLPLVHAAVPKLMTYQGVLKNGSGSFLTGTYSMTFRIYSASTGGTALWTETQSSVSASSGKFSVQLGSVTTLNLDFNSDYWLSIQVGADAEMSPRIRLTSMGYGIRSDYENNGFTQTQHDALTHKAIEGVKDNTVNISKTNFKLDSYTVAAANSMGDLIVDTLNDATGINAGASSGYTYRGTPNYDVTTTPSGGGVSEQITDTSGLPLEMRSNVPSTYNGVGQQFRHASQVTVDKAGFRCRYYTTLTGNMRIRLYSSNAGVPGTLLAESLNLPASSCPEGSFGEVTASFPPVTLSANTPYLIVLENYDFSGGGNGSNSLITVSRSSGEVNTNGVMVWKSDTGTWTPQAASSGDVYFKLYEQVAYSGTATVISNAYSEPAAPTEAMVTADETLGTGSITYYVSRDNGTTWTQVTKETVTSLSPQPSGTQVKWKAVITGNAELNAIALAV